MSCSEHTCAACTAAAVSAAVHCPRGRFYPDKNFGSTLSSAGTNAELTAAVRNALRETGGVFVKKAERRGNELIVSVVIQNEERSVRISFEENL